MAFRFRLSTFVFRGLSSVVGGLLVCLFVEQQLIFAQRPPVIVTAAGVDPDMKVHYPVFVALLILCIPVPLVESKRPRRIPKAVEREETRVLSLGLRLFL